MQNTKQEAPANDNKFTPELWKVLNALAGVFPYVGVIPHGKHTERGSGN